MSTQANGQTDTSSANFKNYLILIALTFLLLAGSLYGSTPYISENLDSIISSNYIEVFYYLTLSGGMPYVIFFMFMLMFIIVLRKHLGMSQRILEGSGIIIITIVLLGGGTYLNENKLKESIKESRPSIVYLAGTNGSGVLGLAPSDFYDQGDKEQRRKYLQKHIQSNDIDIPINPLVLSHWFYETGYSFPSGHSIAAMYIATFFLGVTLVLKQKSLMLLFYLLLPWALIVSFSRVILHVHYPIDVMAGSVIGIVTGLVGSVLFHQLISIFGRKI